MASEFIEHCLPGVFALTFGLWLTFNVFFRYYKALLLSPGSYCNAVSFPWKGRVPLDMYIVCGTAGIGFVVEFYEGLAHGNIGNWEQLPALVLFEAMGIVVILRMRKWELPENLEYVLLAGAFGMKALMFYYHLGTHDLHTLVHKFVCYFDIAIAGVTLAEMAHPRSILVALSRCFFILSSATWYFTLAQILYPLSGDVVDMHNHKKIMEVPVYVVWNQIYAIMTISVIGMIQYQKVRDFKKANHMKYSRAKGTPGEQEPLNNPKNHGFEI